MLKNTSYKKKCYMLLIGSFTLVILSYQLSLRKTIYYYTSNKTNKNKVAMLKDAPEQLYFLKQKQVLMNSSLGYVGSANVLTQEYLLDFISKFADNTSLFIKSMPKATIEDKNGYQLETNIIELQGNFHDMVSLIYLIEHKNKISKVASANFSINKNFQNQKQYLTVQLFLQNINLIQP